MTRPNHSAIKTSHQIAVQYAVESRRGIPAADSIRNWVTAALTVETQQACELTVRFAGENEMAALNHRYRNKTGATNVLSFPAPATPPEMPLRLLGDIVICPVVALRESRSQQKTMRAHMAHLTIHGTLHLLGFDHIQQAEADIMENLERRILASQGFRDPYRTEIE